MKKQNEIKPPSAPDIEAAVLGSIMIDNIAGLKTFQMLKPKHFFLKANAIIYETMIAIFENDIPIDTVTM